MPRDPEPPRVPGAPPGRPFSSTLPVGAPRPAELLSTPAGRQGAGRGRGWGAPGTGRPGPAHLPRSPARTARGLLPAHLGPPRTLCAAGSDAPSSLPCRPKSSPGPGSGTCSSSSCPHTWTRRRRRRRRRSGRREGRRGTGREKGEEVAVGARRRGGQRRHQEAAAAAGATERPRGRQGRREPRRARGAAVRGPRPSGLGACRPGGLFPAARLSRPSGPAAAAAAEPGPGGRLPGAEGLGGGGGASHTRRARAGGPSYRGDEHPPQPRTGLHHRRPAPDAMLRGNDASRSGRAAAGRKRRRRRRCQPRAAAAPGGKGRRAAREERPEPQLYGGPAGTRGLPRSPAGQRGAWRASCGAERGGGGGGDGVGGGLSPCGRRGCGMLAPRAVPRPGRQDPWPPDTGFSNFLVAGSKVPRGPGAAETPTSLPPTHLICT